MNKLESPTGVPVQRMVRALRDLFKNPMPHDLIAIRREVATEYGGDDEAAKQAMDAWCSQEYMEIKVEAHRTAWNNAADVLRECGPNAELSEPGGPVASESTERVAPPGFAPVTGSGTGRK